MNGRIAAKIIFTACIAGGVALTARSFRSRPELASTPESEAVAPEPYILYADLKDTFSSRLGTVRLQTVSGYLGRSSALAHLPVNDERRKRGASAAILMYIDGPYSAEQRIALGERFREATDGWFQLESPNFTGGDPNAFALISAGTSSRKYGECTRALTRGETPEVMYRGYFAATPPPNFEEVGAILRRLLVDEPSQA